MKKEREWHSRSFFVLKVSLSAEVAHISWNGTFSAISAGGVGQAGRSGQGAAVGQGFSSTGAAVRAGAGWQATRATASRNSR
jgi:hypothetical protein